MRNSDAAGRLIGTFVLDHLPDRQALQNLTKGVLGPSHIADSPVGRGSPSE